jgi:threonylcarbamoyladenosine tRNA methylthiotransferase MtaB
VPVAKRRERSRILHEISERKKLEFYRQNENTNRTVLWESDKHNAYMYGFTDNYIKVRTLYNEQFVNEITPVMLTNLNRIGDDDVYDCKLEL